MDAIQSWDEPRPVKLTIADFMRLDEAGAFDAYAKTELIDGVVVAMNAQFSTHARIKSRFFRQLADAVDKTMPGHEAWAEVSIGIPPTDMPEPDIVVTGFKAHDREPVPVDTIALIVEVSDTTLRYDLGIKARLNAAAGVPEYWIVDIEGRTVHRFWAPGGSAFANKDEAPFGTTVLSQTVPGLMVDTIDL